MSQALILETHLKKLRLPSILKHYHKLAAEAAHHNKTHEQYLLTLLEEEVRSREENTRSNRIRQAHFPTPKAFSQFDFSSIPTLNKPQVLRLAQGEYLEKAENVVLLGNSGTGKTHIATALGMEACAQGKKVLFHTAAELVNLLTEAQAQYRLSRVEHKFSHVDLLIVDELGYLPLAETGLKLLFSLLAKRHEKKSTIITTNLPFEQWGQIFGDPAMTVALVDRLAHYCHLLEMNGDSYRFKDSLRKKEAAA